MFTTPFAATMGTTLAKRAGQEVVKSTVRTASKRVVTKTVSRAGQEVVKLAAQAGSGAGQEVVKTGVREVSEEVVTQTASQPAAGLGSPLATGAACATAFESLHIARDIYSAHKDMKSGKIDRNEFDRAATKRVITGVGNVGGSTVGAVVGQALVPVPILGSGIGAAVGGIIGKHVGNEVGDSLL